MGGKGSKKSRTSTELTPKGLSLPTVSPCHPKQEFFSLEIDMLKANTKFTEKGNIASSLMNSNLYWISCYLEIREWHAVRYCSTRLLFQE